MLICCWLGARLRTKSHLPPQMFSMEPCDSSPPLPPATKSGLPDWQVAVVAGVLSLYRLNIISEESFMLPKLMGVKAAAATCLRIE